jgi:hypothetical protein
VTASPEQFKTYVHKRLDDAGIPVDPDREQNAQTGCRIGGRLDYVLGRLERLERLERLVRIQLDMLGRACSDYSWAHKARKCSHPCCAWIEQARETLGIPSPFLPPIVKGSPP